MAWAGLKCRIVPRKLPHCCQASSQERKWLTFVPALAARRWHLLQLMRNEGTFIAHDQDRHRLRPIFERVTRSGASMIEVVAADNAQRLAEAGPYDCVLIDAPCTGSGSWRRKPDAKWRLTEKQLQQRLKDQRQVLEKGFQLVKPGGRLGVHHLLTAAGRKF